MDTVSPLVYPRARDLMRPLAALVACALVLILLAFAAQLLGVATAGPLPDLDAAPFRWSDPGDGLA